MAGEPDRFWQMLWRAAFELAARGSQGGTYAALYRENSFIKGVLEVAECSVSDASPDVWWLGSFSYATDPHRVNTAVGAFQGRGRVPGL